MEGDTLSVVDSLVQGLDTLIAAILDKAEEQRLDSLNLEAALQHALGVAKDSAQGDSFAINYVYLGLDSLEKINIEIKRGDLLGNRQQYLLIQRFYPRTEEFHLDWYRFQEAAVVPY